jgi:hypothetical protein
MQLCYYDVLINIMTAAGAAVRVVVAVISVAAKDSGEEPAKHSDA